MQFPLTQKEDLVPITRSNCIETVNYELADLSPQIPKAVKSTKPQQENASPF